MAKSNVVPFRRGVRPDSEPPASGPQDALHNDAHGVLDGAVLFRRHGHYVAALATRLLGRVPEVDDLVQDVFVRAIKGLHRVRCPESIQGWLAAITVRLAYGRLSVRKVRRKLGLDDDYDYTELASRQLGAEQRSLLAHVYRSLDALPVADRVPWTLRYVEGESIDEIARICKCSPATVKRRVERAQQALEREFADE